MPAPLDKALPNIDIDSPKSIYPSDPIPSTGGDDKPNGAPAPGCSVIYNSPMVHSDLSILTLLGGTLSLYGFVVWRKRG